VSTPQRGRPVPGDEASADAALVAAARGGDATAFTGIFRAHAGRVHVHLKRLLGPVPDRDDLVQQVFVALHRALPSFRGDSALATFIHRITVNAATDYLRSRRRHARAVPHAAEAAGDAATFAGADQVAARHELERLWRLLDRLSVKKRIAFVLVAVEQRTAAEAAALVGASEDAVKQRVLAARRELLALMEREDEEGSR
jgi:RNA polymerase sigma-70 factor, ECF subfamily